MDTKETRKTPPDESRRETDEFESSIRSAETSLADARRRYHSLWNSIGELKAREKILRGEAEHAERLLSDLGTQHAEEKRKLVERANSASNEYSALRKLFEQCRTESMQRLHERELKITELTAAAREQEGKAREAESRAREHEARAREVETRSRELEIKARESESKAHGLNSEMLGISNQMAELQRDCEQRLQAAVQEFASERLRRQAIEQQLASALERIREFEAEAAAAGTDRARATELESHSDRLRASLIEHRNEIQRLRTMNETLAAMVRDERAHAPDKAPDRSNGSWDEPLQ